MSNAVQNIVFVVKADDAEACKSAESAKNFLVSRGIKVKKILNTDLCLVTNHLSAELICVFGGDGTMLNAVGTFGCLCPYLGINFGHLGFLVNSTKDCNTLILHAIQGEMTTEERYRLDIKLQFEDCTQQLCALNDVSVRRYNTGHIIHCKTNINGQQAYDFQGDGIVVSSATGSTAYALSCGGPILSPKCADIVVCPVSPHTLSARPIVVNSNDVVQLQFPDLRNLDDILINVDAETIKPKSKLLGVCVTSSKDYVKILRNDEGDFFKRIKSSL